MGEKSARSTGRALSRRKLDTRGDSELVELVREGDTQAFGVLWQRHAEPGKAVARGVSASQDPDDLVAEAFTKIFQSIQAGKGPTTAFRAYLFTTIRNVSASWGRSSKESSTDELDDLVDPKTLEDESLAALDRSLTANAFRSLPTRWQEALWYSEVEGMTVQQIAPLLGMKPNAVSALTFRAREGLRQAWIQVHISSVPEDSDCRWSIDRLGSQARGALGPREQTRQDRHLAGCGRCSIIASEAQEVGSRLALILLPLAAGIGGAASYLNWGQTDGASSLLAALTPGPLPASVTASFGTTAAVSTAVLATGTTIALVGIAALGLVGGATAVAPLFFVSNPPHSVAQPIVPDADAPPLADSVSPPAVGIPLSPSPSPSDIPVSTTTPTTPPTPPLPESPTVGSPASGSVIGSSTVRFSGTAPRSDAGNRVEVSGGVSRARAMFAGAIGADGSWTVEVGPLADGTHALDIRQHTSLGTTSKPTNVVVTIDTDAIAPEFSLVRDPSDRLLPSAAGIAEPGATVELVDASNTTIDRASADAAGNWSIAAVRGLGFGEQTIAARQTDAVGNVSALTRAETLILNPVAIPALADGATVARPALVDFSGDPGAGVQVTIDGQPVRQALDAQGALSLSLPDGLGDHTLSVSYAEADSERTRFGPARAIRFTVVLTAPTVSSPTSGASHHNDTIRILGQTPPIDAGNKVEVSDGAGHTFTGTVRADGSWTVDAGPLADGVHTLSIRQRALTGDVSAPATLVVTVDTSLQPPAFTLTPDPTGRLFPSAAGTAEPGARVELVNELNTTIAEATADAAGGWSIDVVGGLGFGENRIAARQTDSLGNSSALTSRESVALAPLNMTSFADGAVVAGGQLVTFQGVQDANFQVSLDGDFDGSRFEMFPLYDVGGTFSFPLPDPMSFGEHSIGGRYVEVVGGIARYGPEVEIAFTLAYLPIGIWSPAAGATVGSSTVRISGEVGPVAVGDTVEVTGGAGGKYTGIVGLDGKWAVDAGPLADGVHTFSILLRTPSGVAHSVPASLTVTVDTTALPPTFSLTPDPNGRLVPSAAGTAEPGATVALVNASNVTIDQTTADASGSWSIDAVAGLGFGSHLIAAQQTDPVGNNSAPTSQKPLTLAPIDITSVADGGTVSKSHVVGFAGVPSARIQVSLDGQPTLLTLGAGGTLGHNLFTAVAYESYSLSVRYSDVVGGINRFGPALSIQVTVAPETPIATSPASGVVSDTHIIRILGTQASTDAGNRVKAIDGYGNSVGEGTVGADGSWTVDAGPLPPGGWIDLKIVQCAFSVREVCSLPSILTVRVSDTAVLP